MLQPIFEAKYIAIKWFNKNIITSMEEAILPIKIEILNESSYCMEIQTYTRIQNGLDGQLAFNILDEQENIQPFFINANNEKIYLIKIIDPKTKKIWWIENGTWSKQHNCRISELWNHVGETNVHFGITTSKINIRAVSFTKKQLELYLEDFKSDFWYLILKKDSLTQAKSKGITDNKIKLLNNETIILLEKFIKDIQVILKNLKKELREIQGLKDIKKVKPIAKTFMEIVSKGYRKKLTSRDLEESYNVAENKYVHFMLYQVYIIVLNMIKASKHIETFYENKKISEIDRLNKFSNFKIIDQEVLNNEIYNLEIKKEEVFKKLEKSLSDQNPVLKKQVEKINNLEITEIIHDAIKNQNIQLYNINQLQTFQIILEGKRDYFKDKIRFFGKIKKTNEQQYHGIGTTNLFSLEFNLNQFDFLQSNQEFLITANTDYTKKQTSTDKTMHEIYFTYISELIPLNINQSTNTNIKYQTLYIKLDKEFRQSNFEKKITFGGNAKLENEQNWYEFKKGNFLSLEFDKNIFENILEEYTEYKITAFIEKSEQKWQDGIIHKRYFKYIEKFEKISISPDEQQLMDFKKEKEKLLLVNWKKELTDKEIKEQEKEKEALKNQIELLKNESSINLEYIEQLKPILRILKENLIKFNQLSISKDSYFPNSMTFIQNPYYQSSYKNYELIKNILGIDENLFLQIQKVELIGILDLPTLYERWCLLQIIKVLINHFRFVPEKNWKNNLAMQILSNPNKIYNIQINFSNEQIKRDVILWYEKILPNKKRPDFVLDIISTETNKKHCLIMDAKFKENVDVECLINSLYPDSMNTISELDLKCPKSNGKIDKKNYSENNKNLVFILHPDSKKSIKNKRTPSYWGNDAYYGETNIFNYTWDKDKFPNHKYGSILLSPIRGENTYGDFLDNLQRLIGMAMQYTIEDNKNILEDNKINPIPKEKEFCIKCGSSDIKLTYSGTSISQKGYYYQMDCQECTHSFVYFYCWNCKYRLIKNGSYWSYHSFQVLNPFDIKCPNCAKYWNQKK